MNATRAEDELTLNTSMLNLRLAEIEAVAARLDDIGLSQELEGAGALGILALGSSVVLPTQVSTLAALGFGAAAASTLATNLQSLQPALSATSFFALTPLQVRARAALDLQAIGEWAKAGPGAYAELAVHVAEMKLHRLGAEEERGRDLTVGRAIADRAGHLVLLWGQVLQHGGGAGLTADRVTGRRQLRVGAPGPDVRAYALELRQSRVEVFSGFAPQPRPAQPLTGAQPRPCCLERAHHLLVEQQCGIEAADEVRLVGQQTP